MSQSKTTSPLGEFIRAHRERVSPQQAGLPAAADAAPKACGRGSGRTVRHQPHLADLD
jgi:hypothetical protein